MAARVWGRKEAQDHDATSAAMFDPAVLGPTVDCLVELARGGPALEFAVGTGRVALELSARGMPTSGVELSPHMVEQLRAKPGADAVEVVTVDMQSARVDRRFSLVYVVRDHEPDHPGRAVGGLPQVAVFEMVAATP